MRLAAIVGLWGGAALAAETPCTVRVEGTVAIITCQLAPPPVIPPPVIPPPVVPPVVPPPRDMTPFVFPRQCARAIDDATSRAMYVGAIPGDDGYVYATLDGEGMALPTHTCAGVIAVGAVSVQGRSLSNRQLWVPARAGTEYPYHIRCALATGRLCP
jgi:hypothetical protein